MTEDGRSEGLQSGSVFGNQVAMVAEKGHQADSEHGGDEEDEENMEFPPAEIPAPFPSPEVHKVAHGEGEYDDTGEEGVAQEEYEKFVIIETHTIIHPRTVVVHLQDAIAAHTAMMRSVWFDDLTLLTVSQLCQVGPRLHWQFIRSNETVQYVIYFYFLRC